MMSSHYIKMAEDCFAQAQEFYLNGDFESCVRKAHFSIFYSLGRCLKRQGAHVPEFKDSLVSAMYVSVCKESDTEIDVDLRNRLCLLMAYREEIHSIGSFDRNITESVAERVLGTAVQVFDVADRIAPDFERVV